MIRPLNPSSDSAVPASKVPAWTVPRGPLESDVEAAFMAGSALNALDNLVRSAPVWGGAWRNRLALSGAAAALRLIGRSEGAAALRDAWCLRRPGDDPGPAGNLLAAWRRLAGQAATLDADRLRSVAALIGLGWSADLSALPEHIDEAVRSRAPAPLAAAAVASAVLARRPDAEPLAWWLADLTLAASLHWPVPVPVLSSQIHAPVLRVGVDRRRARPKGEGAARTMLIAAAAGAAQACRIAGEIDRRAAHLHRVAPKLRAKGAGEAIGLLLSDDAVPGTLTTRALSRWASRRLFDRLVSLDAVRELTGRGSFKLYGL